LSSLIRFWEALELPIEGLANPIEVSNKVENLLLQILSRREAASLEETTN